MADHLPLEVLLARKLDSGKLAPLLAQRIWDTSLYGLDFSGAESSSCPLMSRSLGEGLVNDVKVRYAG